MDVLMEKNTEQSLSSYLNDFQAYMEERNMSKNTMRAYLYAVEQFLTRYRRIGHDNLMLYKCFLMEHYKPQTVNLRIRALNCFLESLHIPISRVMMIRVQQKSFLENVVSQADYEYLKNCLFRDGNLLYYFVIRIMATTGMRVSELILVQAEDVRRGYMDLYSKDNKVRRIYIPQMVRRDCLQWLKSIGRNSGCIFLNRYGNPISPGGIRIQLKRLTARYCLNPDVIYPHSFRHLFAKKFIEMGGDISLLSDILGHESIETTRIYLHRSSSEQKQIINQIVDW